MKSVTIKTPSGQSLVRVWRDSKVRGQYWAEALRCQGELLVVITDEAGKRITIQVKR